MKELAPYSLHNTPSTGKKAEVPARPTSVEEGIDLRDYGWVLKKRAWLIALVFLGTVLTTAVVVFSKTPIYTAETTVLIEQKGPPVLNFQPQAFAASLQANEDGYYKTQYEILRSRAVAAQVIRELRLDTNPYFTGAHDTSLWTRGRSLVAPQKDQESPPPVQAPEQTLERTSARSLHTYMNMLHIEPVQRTHLVKIAFSTPDPLLSAQMADAHAQAYIRQGLGRRTKANEGALRFLEEKLGELKDRVQHSEADLNRYRRDQGIISLDDKENIVVKRLTDLNRRLTEAEAERIALEAQVRVVRKKDYDSLPAVIESSLVQTLKEQLAPLQAQYAQLSVQFKPDYPPLARLRAQINEAQRRLQQETRKVVNGIQSSYLAAEGKEKELRVKMDEQKAATLGLKDASVQYAILAREVDTNRQLYDNVLQRLKEVGMAADLHASNVSVIDQAEPPLTHTSPNRRLSLLLSAMIGLVGGVGLAFFIEYLDNTLKTPEEVQRYLHLPNLVVVPDFSRVNQADPAKLALNETTGSAVTIENGRGTYEQQPTPSSHTDASGTELILSQHPFSLMSESYRTLRTAILLSRAGKPPRTLLFTSGMHGEGKTATTLNTALSFAQMDLKVLVIDADLRRPRCHKVLRMQRGTGLTDVLTGQRQLQDVVNPTTLDNFFFLSSGSPPPNPAELLGSRKMADTLAVLKKEYDYILIDAPPVMPMSDAVLLSPLVEGVVLVVGGQSTPKYMVRDACARLEYAQAKILGVVLNKVKWQNVDYAHYYDNSPYYTQAEQA